MPDFFSQLDIFQGFDQATEPDPLENVKPSLRWLKDSLASASKSRYVEDDLFDPQNTHLSTDEYRSKVVAEKEQAKLDRENAEKSKLIQDGATKLNADAMLAQINAVRQAQGQLPLLPEKADLNDPNTAQAIFSALGSFMFPQFAFDIAAQPFQHRLNEQSKEQARLDQAHNETLRRAGVDAELALKAGEVQQRTNEINYQTQANREARQDEQAFQKEVIGINFQNALTMESSGFARQLTLLDRNQKHQMGMFFINAALDPNVGPEVRASAQAKLTEMGIEIAPIKGSSAAGSVASSLGIDPAQLAGMTINELNQFVGVSLALKDEKRRADLFPEQKRQMEQQGKLIDVQVKFASGMARMQYDLGLASLRNTNSEIENRVWMQNYNTEEQQRARLGQLGTIYQGGRDALSAQYIANAKLIEGNNKLLADASLDDKKDGPRLRKENEELVKQNETILGKLNDLDKDYDGLADRFRADLGMDVKGTSNGEAFLGTPYSWGGGSLSGPTAGIGKGAGQVGFDCSGLTRAVANLDYGVKIPRTAKEQWDAGTGLFTITTSLDKGDPIEGDFLYFRDGDKWHTGILVYHVEGNELVAYIRHAPQTGSEVRDDPLEGFMAKTSKKFVGIRRIQKNSPNPK